MKNKGKIIAILASLAAACTLGACESSSSKPMGSTSNYEWSYLPSMAEECDSDMKIDGVLDEARWQGKKQLVHKENGITMTYSTAFSQKGLYIAATAHDSNMEWAGRLRYNENSCFWFSVKGPNIDTNYARSNEVFNIYVDGNNASSMNMSRFMAKGKTDKPYSENPQTLTAEVFMSWDSLNIELGENGELPEFVWINPHYRYVGGSGRDTWLNPLLFYDNNDRQQCSAKFSDIGYINADAENAVIGNAANGMAKSDGWDLSRIGEGVVTSVTDHAQAIFFTDVYSTAYMYTVKTKPLDKTVNGKMGRMGVCNMVDEIAFHSFFLNQQSVLQKSTSLYSSLSFYREGLGAYVWEDLGVCSPEYVDGEEVVEYTVIKDGGYFYFIVDGKFLYSTYLDYMQEASCPGLFATDCVAEFFDYSATDLSANPAQIDELLEEYGTYRIKTPQVVSGGNISLSTAAVNAGESVIATLTPARGYILTGFTVNGEDKYDEIVSGMVDGAYTFTNITKTTELVPVFTRIPQTVRVMGKVTQADGETPVLKAQLTVRGADTRLFYTTTVSATGAYTLELPANGNQTIADETFAFNGEYTVKVKASGFKSQTASLAVTGTERITKNYTLDTPDYTKDSWGILEDDGAYAAADNLQHRATDYHILERSADTAVLQAKITMPTGATFPSRAGIGITFTDGTTLSRDFVDGDGTTRKAGSYVTREIGISNQGLFFGSYLIGCKMRYPGVWGGDSFSELQYDNSGLSLWSSGVTERTLSIALFEKVLYIYIDGKFMTELTLSSTEYWHDGYTFASTENLRFGVFFFETQGVDFQVALEQSYGNDALTVIEEQPLFAEVRESTKVKTSYNIALDNGVYKAQGANYYKSSYAYTSETYSDTIVYKVKMSITNGIAGYKDQLPNVGITLTNGTIIPGNTLEGRYVPYNSYFSAQIGLSHVGIVSQLATNGSLARRIDSDNRWDFATVNDAYAIKSGESERTLTLILYKDKLYIYVDDNFAQSLSITNANYFKLGDYSFAAGGTYVMGVNATNIDHTVNPVSLQVVTQLYGDAALAEIQSRHLYAITCDGTTTSTFRNMTANSTVVFSLDISTLNGIPTPYCNDAGQVGIAISNSAAPTEVMTIGFSQMGIHSTCNQGMYRRWDGTDKWGTTVNSSLAFAGWANKGGTLRSGKLTVVIYNDTLYVYAGATTETLVNSGSLLNGGGWVNLASFATGAQWTVGVGATNIYNLNGTIAGNALDCSAWDITIVERNRLYGSEALQYIKDNYSANISVS